MSEEAALETSEMRWHAQLISLARFSRSRLQRSAMLQQLEEQVTSDADARLFLATYKGMCAVRTVLCRSAREILSFHSPLLLCHGLFAVFDCFYD
jgi:hypothetical protein